MKYTPKEIKEFFLDYARLFYTQRGAKFNQRQTVADLDLEGMDASLPDRLANGGEFVTLPPSIASNRSSWGGGDSIILPLWVAPILKNGKQGAPIRLTWFSLPS